MKTANLLVMSILTVVLISGTFLSLATAQDETKPESTEIPNETAAPDEPTPDSGDSPQDDGDAILYSAQGNSTATDDTNLPSDGEAEDANLLSAQTGSDNTLLLAAVAVALVVVVAAVGVLCYRKKAASTQN